MGDQHETARGGLGVGMRLNHHDERLKELKKKVENLEQRIDSSAELGDLVIADKPIRISLTDGMCYEGTVIAISKFRVKLKMTDGKERTFNKGHIKWHEDL